RCACRTHTSGTLLPLVHRYVGDIARTGVLALRADEAVVAELLQDVGRPAGDPGPREHRGEEVGGNAEAVVDRGGIEVHVGVDAATRAAKVDALNSWSACRMRATSMARSASGRGRSPVSM